jgi:PAS domain S-box-containing protein
MIESNHLADMIKNLLEQNLIDHRDRDAIMEMFFWQAKANKNISTIYFGDAAGGFVSAGREAHNDSLFIVKTDIAGPGTVTKYRVGFNNEVLYKMAEAHDFDSRTRNWYINAHVGGGGKVWTDPFIGLINNDLTISLSQAIYSRDGYFLGVVAVCLYSSHLNQYLRDMREGDAGRIMIFDSDMNLIATTEDIDLFEQFHEEKDGTRASLNYSADETLTTLRNLLHTNHLSDFHSLPNATMIPHKHDRVKHFLFTSYFSIHENEIWAIFHCMPEKDFLHARRGDFVLILISIGFMLISSLIIAMYFSVRVTKPITDLHYSVSLLSEGDYQTEVKLDSSILEIESLGQKFNEMIVSIAATIKALNFEITKRYQAESEMEREKELLEVTLKSISDGVIITNEQGKIMFMNGVAEKLTEFTEEEASNLYYDFVFKIVNPTTNQFYKDIIPYVVHTGEALSMSENVVLISKSWKKYHINLCFTPLKYYSENIKGMVLVFKDTTEKEKLMETVINTQKLESFGHLAGGIAMEFNNLLTGISNYIDFASSGASEKSIFYLAQATGYINKARSLTQHLLLFSTDGSSVPELNKIETFIKEIVNIDLNIHKIYSELHIAPDLYDCKFNRDQIRQALDIIITNAIEAMPNGGIIEVDAENTTIEQHLLQPGVSNKFVKITITDYGVGISADDLKQIFDPFFTTKGSTHHGLGLTLAQSIVSKHRGYLIVESTPSLFTKFSIILPASDEVVSEADGKDLLLNYGKGTILVLENDVLLQLMFKNMLYSLGYNPIIVTTEALALEKFIKATEDKTNILAIILDINVRAGIAGTDILAEIKKQERDIPVLITSTNPDDPAMVSPERYGYTAGFKKPFSLNELNDMLYNNIET